MAAQHILPSTPVAFHSAGWSQLTHVGLNCVRPCARAHIRSAVASSSMGFESVRNQVAAARGGKEWWLAGMRAQAPGRECATRGPAQG